MGTLEWNGIYQVYGFFPVIFLKEHVQLGSGKWLENDKLLGTSNSSVGNFQQFKFYFFLEIHF